MDVSFIIPLFNRLDLAQPCFDSLRASLPAGLTHEIILIDDASTDGTRAWLATLRQPGLTTLLNPANRGYAHTVNRGAHAARGRFLALLNSDLLFNSGWLPPLLDAFTRFPDTGLVGNIQLRADTGRLDHAGIVINARGKPEHLDASWSFLRLQDDFAVRPAVTGACCLVERDRFLAAGGFDEAFRNGGEDIDLCFRLRRAGHLVRVAHRSVVRHHVSASPGRKRHDEPNSRHLCRLWRRQLIDDAAAYWPRAYLHAHWAEPRHADPALLLQALLRATGLVRTPAPGARASIEAEILLQEHHWRALLGPEPADPLAQSASVAPAPTA